MARQNKAPDADVVLIDLESGDENHVIMKITILWIKILQMPVASTQDNKDFQIIV